MDLPEFPANPPQYIFPFAPIFPTFRHFDTYFSNSSLFAPVNFLGPHADVIFSLVSYLIQFPTNLNRIYTSFLSLFLFFLFLVIIKYIFLKPKYVCSYRFLGIEGEAILEGVTHCF